MNNRIPNNLPNPSTDALIGRVLVGGWKVEGKVIRRSDATGGHFSNCYHVVNVDKNSPHHEQQGFLKALDYDAAMQETDVPRALQRMTEEFNFERDLVELCKGRRMRHIVRGVESGEAHIADVGPIDRVNYLIFEAAEHDIRSALALSNHVDLAWIFRTLHNVANGLQLLHSVQVFHQDVKPSNVLEFGEFRKIGDLGRASRAGVKGPFDDIDVAGDHGYATPELLYGFVHQDEGVRRRASDCYQLGGLIYFLFAGVSLTTALIVGLDENLHPANYGGNYEAILPSLRHSFDGVVRDLTETIPQNFQTKTLQVFKELADPDIHERGLPRAKKGTASRFRLDRYVSHFDLLSRKANLALKTALQ